MPSKAHCITDGDFWTKAESEVHREAMMEPVAVTHELAAGGRFISASPLHPVATATSIRVRNGHRIITDGPFAETREVLGGYYLILASSRDEALSIAARHSGARVGTVEVRPLFDLSNLRSRNATVGGRFDSAHSKFDDVKSDRDPMPVNHRCWQTTHFNCHRKANP